MPHSEAVPWLFRPRPSERNVTSKPPQPPQLTYFLYLASQGGSRSWPGYPPFRTRRQAAQLRRRWPYRTSGHGGFVLRASAQTEPLQYMAYRLGPHPDGFTPTFEQPVGLDRDFRGIGVLPPSRLSDRIVSTTMASGVSAFHKDATGPEFS